MNKKFIMHMNAYEPSVLRLNVTHLRKLTVLGLFANANGKDQLDELELDG